eukprot:m.58689 g.58689  ORF g.58689 m.58689 type:complete len:52 (+) comp34823_c0_seq1:187-342(+)
MMMQQHTCDCNIAAGGMNLPVLAGSPCTAKSNSHDVQCDVYVTGSTYSTVS